MTAYRIVRRDGRTFIYATSCDYSSHIEVNPALIDPQTLLSYFRNNDVAPEHIFNVYEDLLFDKNVL